MTKPKPRTQRLLPVSQKKLRANFATSSVANAANEPETVEAFMARGGLVERLDSGERGQPLVRNIRDRKAQEFKVTTASRAAKQG